MVVVAIVALLAVTGCGPTFTASPPSAIDETLPPRVLRSDARLVQVDLCPLTNSLPPLRGRLEVDLQTFPYVWLVDAFGRRLEVAWPPGFSALDAQPPVIGDQEGRVIFTHNEVVEFPYISPREHSGTPADPYPIEGQLGGQCYVEVKAA